MGLDVELVEPTKTKDICYHCHNEYEYNKTLYESNITHNLGIMAQEAHIYDILWRPFRLHGLTDKEDLESETEEIVYAKELIPMLKLGLKDMKERPDYYKKFNSENGWGLYEHFVPFVEKYLNACIKYPESIVRVDR